MSSIVILVGSFAPGLAGADPSPSAGGDQGRRDEITKQRAKVAGQIDLLRASDVDLQVEVNRLANLVKTADAQLGLARAGIADIERKLGGLSDEVDQGRRDVETARGRASARAVQAYMHPGIESLGAVLEARDYDQAHRRRTIIGELGRHDQEIIQGYVDAQKGLEARQARLADARKQADELRVKAEDSLSQLQAAQARQVEARQALDARIRDFQGEADELAAQEANLTSLINRRAVESRAAAASPEVASPPSAPSTSTAAAPSSTPAGNVPGGNVSKPTSPPTNLPATAAPSTAARPSPSTTRPPTSGTRLSWPLSGVLTSPFGTRWGRLHAGIDIGVPTGTPIRAAAGGTVFFCGVMGGYGNVALIDHGNGLVSLYGHQNNLACSDGQRVGGGQVIGYSGNTGHSTGPHLHFEVRRNGTPVDPMQYLA